MKNAGHATTPTKQKKNGRKKKLCVGERLVARAFLSTTSYALPFSLRGGEPYSARPLQDSGCVSSCFCCLRGREGNKWYQRFPNPTACIENINNSNNKSRRPRYKKQPTQKQFYDITFHGKRRSTLEKNRHRGRPRCCCRHLHV